MLAGFALTFRRTYACRLRDLPTALGSLTNLRVLYMEGSFRGRSPPNESEWQAVLGGMSSLAVLSLRESRLGGKVPMAVAAMTTLRVSGAKKPSARAF